MAQALAGHTHDGVDRAVILGVAGGGEAGALDDLSGWVGAQREGREVRDCWRLFDGRVRCVCSCVFVWVNQSIDGRHGRC